MKAVALRGTSLIEVDREEVLPGAGQVLVATQACGICGSDLHAVHDLFDTLRRNAGKDASGTIDPEQDLILGHEFCGEILDHGPGCTGRLKAGSRVVSVPYVIGPQGQELVGFSTRYPGGLGERMILSEHYLLAVPNGLPSEQAALTEPMAVGAHAVAAVDRSSRPVALVIGCGPVGLAVIASLKVQGIGPVIAADFSAHRRALAERIGADVVVDPAQASPHAQWDALDVPATLGDLTKAQLAGRDIRRAAIFDCVGGKGLLQAIIEQAPPLAQIIAVGTCSQPDTIVPKLAARKELRFDFVFAYTPTQFEATLHDIAEGRIDVAPLISRVIGRSEVPAAFVALEQPDMLGKIVIDPRKA